MKKLNYIAPEISQRVFGLAYGILDDLTSDGEGGWNQTINPSDDDETEDDGRAKFFGGKSVWD